jgi:hypothetical protein
MNGSRLHTPRIDLNNTQQAEPEAIMHPLLRMARDMQDMVRDIPAETPAHAA